MSDEIQGGEFSFEGEATPVAPVAPAAPAVAPDAPLPEVELKWNGRSERVPFERARELAQMGYDYTQKTQRLAQEREAFNSERTQYQQSIDELREFLNDDRRLEQYLNQLRAQRGIGAPQPPAGGTPDDLLTRAQLEEVLKAREQELLGRSSAEIRQLEQKLQVDRMAATYKQELDGEISRLKASHRDLQRIPRVEKLLRDEVRAMAPQSVEEAKEMLGRVAQSFVQEMRNAELEARKDQPPSSTTVPLGIEPRGGAAPAAPAPPIFKSVKDPDFKRAVMEDVMRLVGGGT